MQVDRFKHSPVGRLVPIVGMDANLGAEYRHFAFVPEALPSTFDLSQRTVKVMTEASLALGRLDANLKLLPNPALLVRPSLRKEAVATTALEGTFAPLAEALEADYLEERQQTAEIREVMNYVRAANVALGLIETKPICLSLIAELQKILVRGTRGDAYDAGQLRQQQVCIGQHGRGVENSRFVPPPPGDALIRGVSDWEKWVNAEDDIPLLAKIAAAHYQFETLHPFSDGNGRLGRLIMTLQLIAAGVLRYPILNLSPWLEPRRDAYIDHLLEVSATGNFDPWVAFFCEAVEARSNAAAKAIGDLLDVRDEFANKLRTVNARGMVVDLASLLIGYPVLDVNDAMKLSNVAFPTANNAIAKLVDLGILEEMTGNKYRRLFRCPRVYEIIARA